VVSEDQVDLQQEVNTALFVAGFVVCVITLVIVGLKMAQKGGEQRGADRERADRLSESAERRAKAERAASMPPPERARLRAAWDRYRRRVSDPESR